MKISIINLNSGNLFSLNNMINYLGFNSEVTDQINKIDSSDLIFLPGVGSFDRMIENLKKKNLYNYFKDKENFSNKTLVGICVGMHILFNKSEEGDQNGLSLLDGNVIKFQNDNIQVPHMGWNKLLSKKFNQFNGKNFYFSHSYFVDCDEDIKVGETNYGKYFPSIVNKKKIFGIQFHPEKSHKNGMQLLKEIISGHNS